VVGQVGELVMTKAMPSMPIYSWGDERVVELAEVPRWMSGKVLEAPVKRILTSTPVERAASRESLANPAALDVFVEMAAVSAST
jgi:hypothetical protein